MPVTYTIKLKGEYETWFVSDVTDAGSVSIPMPTCEPCPGAIAKPIPEDTCDTNYPPGDDSTTCSPYDEGCIGVFFIQELIDHYSPLCALFDSDLIDRICSSASDYGDNEELLLLGLFRPNGCCYLDCLANLIDRRGADTCLYETDFNAIIADHPECIGMWEWVWNKWVRFGQEHLWAHCLGFPTQGFPNQDQIVVEMAEDVLPAGSFIIPKIEDGVEVKDCFEINVGDVCL